MEVKHYYAGYRVDGEPAMTENRIVISRDSAERHFREFLGVTGCIGNFAIACADSEKSLKYVQEKHEPKNWVTAAFNWFTTHEGVDFWTKVNQEWLEYLCAVDKESRL